MTDEEFEKLWEQSCIKEEKRRKKAIDRYNNLSPEEKIKEDEYLEKTRFWEDMSED